MTTVGKYRIMIYGPKEDGTYVVEFRTDAGQVFALSIPRTETEVIRRFKERMPYGLRAATAPETGNAPTQKMSLFAPEVPKKKREPRERGSPQHSTEGQSNRAISTRPSRRPGPCPSRTGS
jgi:hypothetical protein